MSNQSEQLTVGKLKELLQKYPDDMLVETEGCDCYGAASGVSTYTRDARHAYNHDTGMTVVTQPAHEFVLIEREQ